MIFTVDLLRLLFHLPIRTAAIHVNLCSTALKSVCRKLSMPRWPFKQLQKTSRLSPSLPCATDSGCSFPPPDPQPNSTAPLLELPSFDDLPLELSLPGKDASDSPDFAENHFLHPLSKRVSFAHDCAPFSASTERPPPDWSVPAAPFSHALAPPVTFGWEPELGRAARMREQRSPPLYTAFRQDKQDPSGGHALSFLSAGLHYMICQG